MKERTALAVARLWPRPLGSIHLWVILAMLVAGAFLHYASPLIYRAEEAPWGLIEHSMDRVLLMVPVVYGGFIFGPWAGFGTLVAITAIMLPRAIFFSSNSTEAILETSAVVLVSSLVILWFGGQQRERERRQEVLSKLELARQELASHVEMISKNEKRLATINEICRVVAQDLDLSQVLPRILAEVAEVMGVPVVLIFLKDRTGQKLELVDYRGVSQDFARAVASLAVGDGFNGRVAQCGEPMVIENASEDSRLSVPQVREEGLHSQLIVPLRSKGVATGTLCVAVRSSRRFTRDDVDLLSAIGSQVGIIIENARLYREALASEERYRDLFENATVAISVHDLRGVITAANKACANLMGRPISELIGMSAGSLFPPSALVSLSAIEKKLIQGETVEEPYEVPLVRGDGTEAIIELTTRLICENVQPTGFQHIARDVTERRRLRNTLNYYIRQILTAQEDERKRIAREIHDETRQSLLLVSQRLDSLILDPHSSLNGRGKAYLEGVRGVIIKTLDDLRHLTQDLRPRILDDLGLVAALEWLADDLQQQCGLRVEVQVSGGENQLSSEAQLLLFRIAQEALSNVRRHAAASQVNIVLEQSGGMVKLSIRDNGNGFPLPARLEYLADEGKLGILGMLERARLLNGTLTVRSEPGQGTVVVAELPT